MNKRHNPIIISLILIFSMISLPVAAEGLMYISIYADQNHTQCNKYITVAPEIITAWVFAHGNPNGLKTVYFVIVAPSGWLQYTDFERNPAAAEPECECPVYYENNTYWCINFDSCQDTEWLWLYNFQYIVWTPSVWSSISINPLSEWLYYTDCSSEEEHPLTIFSNFMLNRECVLSSEQKSWGAIKALLSN